MRMLPITTIDCLRKGRSTAMSDIIKRLAEYYKAMGEDYVELQEAIWVVYNKMVVAKAPVCRDNTISADQERFLLSRFRNAILVRSTDGFQSGPADSPWYAVTCRKFIDLDECSSKLRSHIRRGLRRCVVRQVDAEYMADNGYDVYAAAYTRYKNVKGPALSRTEWERTTRADKSFPDLRDYWAVFVDNQLAGYSKTMNYGNIETAYDVSKYDPKHLGDYSAYAMQFTMNEYYLRQRQVGYVNVGFRTISHDTNIQEFRIKNFGFERTPTNLYVRYHPWVAAALSIPRFAKRWLGTFSSHYASLCVMDDARCRDVRRSIP